MSGPLSMVLEAASKNQRSVSTIAHTTGLSTEVVTACVDHLVRAGRLASMPLASGCPTTGCGSCVFRIQCKPRIARP
ncbi:MAG: FeoC-like transcriptional regulator [Propionibacteriaceae bacterium]|nr:FeoC-like transcriptional regulator [Propionibacteriaceae bacterium]